LLQYENWTIVPKKEKLLLLAVQFRGTGVVLEPVTKVCWFRRADVLRTLRKLPSDHGLEAVTLMLADDAEDYAAYSLLSDLTKLAVKADFTLMSLIVPRFTTDLRSIRQRERWQKAAIHWRNQRSQDAQTDEARVSELPVVHRHRTLTFRGLRRRPEK
jgi:hypothetical protein